MSRSSTRHLRPAMVALHRWFGLGAAVFLFIAGFTGAFISWDHELDAWLNPQLYKAQSGGTSALRRDAITLAGQLEKQEPRLRVTYFVMAPAPGHTLLMSVEGKLNPATGHPYDLGYNQVALDPVTGVVQGRRQWGEISLSRANLLPFLYKLHYTMHIPQGWGIEFGIWLMGLIAIVWVADCFIALWLSFPNWRSWRKSFAFRWHEGGHKLNFDLHRSGGVWIWALLLMVAITSVSMNLNSQVVRPLVASLSTISKSAFDTRVPNGPEKPIEAGLSRDQAVALARSEAQRRGWKEPVGGLFYSSSFGLYGIGFFEPGKDHGDGGLGNAWLYFDAINGSPAGASVPGTGSAGDIFLQAQFPLHSGRIIGMPGRILMSVVGALVAMLSATGVIIWARKRKARVVAARTVRRPAISPEPA